MDEPTEKPEKDDKPKKRGLSFRLNDAAPPPEVSHDDEGDDVGPVVDPDVAAAAASAPKHMAGTPPEPTLPVASIPTVTTPPPLATPRAVPPSRLRRHMEEEELPLAPLEMRDGPPPPTAVVVPYGRGVKPPETRRASVAPAAPVPVYSPVPTRSSASPEAAASSGPVTEMRMAQPRPEAPPPTKGLRRDPGIGAIHEALAHLGPPETVVDVAVEVFDEAMNQFWTIGGAAAQPLSIIREPHRYLKYNGYYRISVCGAGEGFDKRKTTSFTARIIGPPRPANWRFDESDVGVNVFGERGDIPMGFMPQQMMPQVPPPDPAEQVVRSVRALKEVEKVLKPDKDDDEKRRADELEAELRMSRQNPWAGWGGAPWAGGGGPGYPGYYRQGKDQDAEERRREAEERRRQEEIERHRLELEKARAEDERRREEERRRDEEKRRIEEDRRREMAEMKAQFDRQMTELQRQREEDKRRWEEERAARQEAERRAQENLHTLQSQREREEERRRYEDSRREEKERWEQQRRDEEMRRVEERRHTEEALAEMRRQNEMLLARMEQKPQESTVDKLLGNLPQLMMQWKDMNTSGRMETLEAQRIQREEARDERERAREDSARQMQMWQEMSRMNVESMRMQSEQATRYSQSLLEVFSKNGSSDILNSVAGAMNMAVQAQTSALSAIAKSGLGGGGGGPSPWVDVAAGAIEAAGNIASSIIAAKVGAPPDAIKQMLMGGGEEGPPPPGPPIRRPPQQLAGPPMPPSAPRPPAPRPAPQAPVRRPPAAPVEPPPQRQPIRVAVPRAPQQPQPQEGGAQGPGLPQKIVQRVLNAAKNGEPPEVVARKLFSLVELCDVNELHKGNEEAERIMDGLTTETKVPEMLRELFSMVDVTDEEYLEAIRRVYIKLIYAYVEALGSSGEGEEEGEDEGDEGDEAAPEDDEPVEAREEPEVPPVPGPSRAPVTPQEQPQITPEANLTAVPSQTEPQPAPKPRKPRLAPKPATPPETPVETPEEAPESS